MMPCACRRPFVPTVEMYRAHVQTPEHQSWRLRQEIPDERVPRSVTPIYVCACGATHLADSRLGRRHMALGATA